MYSKIVTDAKEYINTLLKDLEKKGYHFHNIDHTLDVFDRATYLSTKEWLSNQETELLQIAALFHDVWFLYNYDDNEKIWAEVVWKYLNWINYPPEKTYIVKQIILATIPFRKPSNILEKIIKDSDLDNLWREDCHIRSDSLRKEMYETKWLSFSEKDWTLRIYNFIEKQFFYVPTQIMERQTKLQENKQFLKEKLMGLI